MKAAEPSTSLYLLAHSGFLRFWGSQATAYLGSQIFVLVLPIVGAITLDVTPVELGVVMALNRAPYVFLALFVGVWVDRLPRRLLIVVSNLAMAVTLIVVPVTAWFGVLTLPVLYVVSLASGVLAIFLDVAYLAIVPLIVERDRLTKAQSLLEISQSGGQVAGPTLGGAVAQAISAPVAMAAGALAYLGGAMAAATFSDVAPKKRDDPDQRVLVAIREGFKVVFGNPILRAVTFATTIFVFFFSSFSTVVILFLARTLEAGPAEIGLIMGLGAAGGALGAVVAVPVGRTYGSGPTMAVSLLAAGIAGLGVSLSSQFEGNAALVAATAFLFLLWASQQIYNVHQVPVRYVLTEAHMVGRVSATIRTVVWGSAPGGALLGGALAEVMGFEATLALSSIGAAAAGLMIFLTAAFRFRGG